MKSTAKQLLLITAILAPLALGAQTKNDLPDFEITGNVRGGLNSLMYKVDGTASKPSLGLGGGIGFNWFFKPAWSFSTGLEYSLYNGSIDLDEVASAQLRDYDGNYKAVYHHTLKNFSEKQRMGALQVPVMFKWLTPLKVTSPHRFYSASEPKWASISTAHISRKFLLWILSTGTVGTIRNWNTLTLKNFQASRPARMI